uniref:Uncharacterized protein n=1 Tax=Bacteriophage sp. TaxID=38018 RepID=A0A8D9PEZ2_9VIRU|nr:MAG TPA: hypothetical protein [Bacteriophage sp.]
MELIEIKRGLSDAPVTKNRRNYCPYLKFVV